MSALATRDAEVLRDISASSPVGELIRRLAVQDKLAEAIRLLQEAANGAHDEGPAVKVRALWDEWAPWAERNRKDWHVKKSHKAGLLDTRIVIGDVETCLGDLNWDRCDIAAADAWRAKMQVTISYHGKFFAPGTRNAMLATLRGCFKWHVARKRIPRHPLKGAPNERERRRVGYFTEETVDVFAGTMNVMCSLILRLAFATGMRNVEARELRCHEVDRAERVIVIPGWRHKNGLPKVVPVPDDIWPELLAQLDRVAGEFVFPSPRKPLQPLGKTGLQYWIAKARRITRMVLPGGEAPTAHHARHGWAIRFMAEGGNMAAAMAIMGHTSVQSTRIYQRPVGPALEATRQLMNRKPPKRAKPPTSTEDYKKDDRDS